MTCIAAHRGELLILNQLLLFNSQLLTFLYAILNNEDSQSIKNQHVKSIF